MHERKGAVWQGLAPEARARAFGQASPGTQEAVVDQPWPMTVVVARPPGGQPHRKAGGYRAAARQQVQQPTAFLRHLVLTCGA